VTAPCAPRVRGIVFSDTVPALVAREQTQARWIVRGAPADTTEVVPSLLVHRGDLWDFRRNAHNPVAIRCPYGAGGDRFYVKEAHAWVDQLCDGFEREDPTCVGYRGDLTARRFYADGGSVSLDTRSWNWEHPSVTWRSAIQIPRWAARLWYEQTSVRVQRVQDITEEDAGASGIRALDGQLDAVDICKAAKLAGCGPEDNRAWFAAAWCHWHGDDAWARNDLVWALTFRPGPAIAAA
jgi:hypothetical protein